MWLSYKYLHLINMMQFMSHLRKLILRFLERWLGFQASFNESKGDQRSSSLKPFEYEINRNGICWKLRASISYSLWIYMSLRHEFWYLLKIIFGIFRILFISFQIGFSELDIRSPLDSWKKLENPIIGLWIWEFRMGQELHHAD